MTAAPKPPEPKRCPQCSSMTCPPTVCRFTGLTHEEHHDWQNAEGPERMRESDEDAFRRDDYRSRYRDIQP